MIASLRGRITARGADHVVVEVQGVGYKVFLTERAMAGLPHGPAGPGDPSHPAGPSGMDVHLHIHQVTREDGTFLFGFETREELALFEMLISVSGVGPRAALALLGVASPAELASSIASGDAAALARAPGVGKKTAERLIVDLRSKVGRVTSDGMPLAAISDDEAQAALVALGFTVSEAAAALRDVPPKGRATTEERVAAALRTART